MIKKIFALLLAVSIVLSAMGCSKKAEDNVSIRIAGLKGPTSIGLVKVMEDGGNGKYEFSLHGSADEVTPKLIKGELDMAAIPSNLASVLYNNTDGEVILLAINTLGVIYIVDKGLDIKSVSDLKGQTIYATGKGSTPEYALRYILSENGIDPDKDVTLEFKSEPTEVVSILSSQDTGVAMLPQPYVTVAQTKVEGLTVAIDLTKAWDDLNKGSQLITGVLVARKSFVNDHPEAVKKFLSEYKASVDYVISDAKGAAALCEKYDIVKAAIAEKAIPYCNITFIEGEDMKAPLSGYLSTLFDQNPKAVGGKLPDDNFYYTAK